MLMKLFLCTPLYKYSLLHQIKVEGTTADQGVIVADGLFLVVHNLENNHCITTTRSSMVLFIVYLQEDSSDCCSD